MTLTPLQARFTALSSTYKQTVSLIHRLESLSTALGQGDDARVELSEEIHLRLKAMEGEMELLRVEMEQLEASGNRRRGNSVKETEREHAEVAMRKLEEDVKSARGQFRKAQLQAKRNAEALKQKERRLLFSGVADDHGGRRRGPEKLTQDDLVVNTSSDVTAALRRTHQLMQAELSRSQFAQETLEQSTAALSSLSESYSSLDTLLASSRSLVTSLFRSQKSDTWYLETAFYILVGTIVWLLFRRIFYGPLWWLVWLPLKMTYRIVFAIWGAAGISSVVQSSSAIASTGSTILSSAPGTVSTWASMRPSTIRVTNMHSGVRWSSETPQSSSDGLIEEIEEMAAEAQRQHKHEEEDMGTNVDDISPEERWRQEQMPRNPKKRMHEERVENEGKGKKHEL